MPLYALLAAVYCARLQPAARTHRPFEHIAHRGGETEYCLAPSFAQSVSPLSTSKHKRSAENDFWGVTQECFEYNKDLLWILRVIEDQRSRWAAATH